MSQLYDWCKFMLLLLFTFCLSVYIFLTHYRINYISLEVTFSLAMLPIIIPRCAGWQPPNFTQVPLQPSSAVHESNRAHPLTLQNSQLSAVNRLSRLGKKLHCQKRDCWVFSPFFALEERNSPPNTNLASYPGFLAPAFVACTTNAGEGLVKLGHVVWRTWTCGGVAHSWKNSK